MTYKIGHDYGIKPFTMVVSDLGFLEYYSKAEFIGIMYISGQEEDGKLTPVQLGLLFKNEEPAVELIKMIVSWAKVANEGEDVLDITFMEMNNNKYVVSISPNKQAVRNRLLPENVRGKVTELHFSPTHFKEFDISDNFKEFKANYVDGSDLAIGCLIGVPSKIVRQSEEFFIQKHINFAHEDDGSSEVAMLHSKLKKGKLQKTPKKPTARERRETENDINSRRIGEIQLYHPIVYNKIVHQGWLKDIREKLQLKYDDGLIIQAICNIVLLSRMKLDGKLNKEVIDNGLANSILDYLVNNHESFKSHIPDDSNFTKYKIESQITRDRKELLTFLSK